MEGSDKIIDAPCINRLWVHYDFCQVKDLT